MSASREVSKIRPATPGTTDSPDVVNDLLSEYLNRIRWQFYPDVPKEFFQQRKMLIKALTFPASWLHKRGVTWPPEQYRSVLDEIILGIQRHGDTAKIAFFPRYFLFCVQQHFRHNDDRYYDLGKSYRAKIDAAIAQLIGSIAVSDRSADHDAVEALAMIHRVVTPGRSRPKKQRRCEQTPSQLDLF